MAQKSILILLLHRDGPHSLSFKIISCKVKKGDIVYELDAHHDVNIHGISLLLSEYRATHTVSAFFLGIFLEDCLTQGQCGADLAVHGDFFPFSYLWFLTCLYHDYGYIVEENWKPSCRRYNEARICSLDGYYRLRNIKRELDITYSPYQQITPLRRSVQRHNKSHRETHDRSTIISYLLGNSPSLKDGSTVCMRSNGHWFPVSAKTPYAILFLRHT